MKKIISFLAGNFLLATILIAMGCCWSADSQDKKEVTIHLIKAFTEDGKKRLKLSDSNGNKATDFLITEVPKGATIYWELKASSNIKNIEGIYSKNKDGVIFKKEAERINDKKFRLIVPDEVITGTIEEYFIKFIHVDGDPVTIDPYIRIKN